MTPIYGCLRLIACVVADNADDFFAAYGGCRHKAGMDNSERKLWLYVSGKQDWRKGNGRERPGVDEKDA